MAALAAVLAALALLLLPAPHAYAETAPRDALRYQRDLIRNARAVWGLDAPVATFAAQIHQESRWRADARSPVGAQGIAQFMPATATWISGVYRWGEVQPYNPAWAMRALVTYDRWLWVRVKAAEPCDRMAMTLSAYNGGLGWVYRDQKLASANDADPLRWFNSPLPQAGEGLGVRGVEAFNAGRSAANFAENRSYPRLILTRWQPLYASWGKGVRCAV